VGFCDNNAGRLQRAVNLMKAKGIVVPGYRDTEFDRMIAETKPDSVLVTTRDCFHDRYICRAMELGCDAITEKPMTITAEKCRRILDVQRQTRRKCTVTFNYRYSPPRTQVKDLLMSGVIGDVLSVDFHWLLDTRHGADYFRRWHRNKKNSGGLMVHKATHHFDLVNWWLSSVPESVFAVGERKFYTPATALRYGLKDRSERCLDCPVAKRCKFYLDLRAYPDLKGLYLDSEKYDGYIRDRCVFSKSIDIEDTMHVIVKYASGASMSYSLHAFMPWEGYIITFNGTRGRLEHKCVETVYLSGDGTVPGQLIKTGTSTMVFPHFKPVYSAPIWVGEGGHGGGDSPLLDDIFLSQRPKDKYCRAADQRAGAYSILVGVAANRSMATGKEVRIRDLAPTIGLPDYPPMSSSRSRRSSCAETGRKRK
jgi:predicted dehydrogenase